MKAVADFVGAVVDDNGFVKNIKTSTFIKHVDKMLREFDYTTVRCEDPTKNEHEKVSAITKAIKNLKRLGLKPTIKALAKITHTNPRQLRNIMVKYGMFNVETKQILNPFEKDSFEWELNLFNFGENNGHN